MDVFTKKRLEELRNLIESLDAISDFEILPGLKVHEVYRSKRVRKALRQSLDVALAQPAKEVTEDEF